MADDTTAAANDEMLASARGLDKEGHATIDHEELGELLANVGGLTAEEAAETKDAAKYVND
ncbi:hypothetical protein [Streptomyces sp. NPDC056600]|uniref:hypothetical protein n=1 Tax=Streptomyces sp. NPDC056600 TaxID=3345874 RepID=UPI0036761A1F